MECLSVSGISLKDWTSDGSGKEDDAWMTEDVNSQDYYHYVYGGDYMDIGTGQDDLPFSCRCGNVEVSCFQQHFNPVSGDL